MNSQVCYVVSTRSGNQVFSSRPEALSFVRAGKDCYIRQFTDRTQAEHFARPHTTPLPHRETTPCKSGSLSLSIPSATILIITSSEGGCSDCIIVSPNGSRSYQRYEPPAGATLPAITILMAIGDCLQRVPGNIKIVCSNKLLHSMYKAPDTWMTITEDRFSSLIRETLKMMISRSVDLLHNNPAGVL